jgi:hypothetical protein
MRPKHAIPCSRAAVAAASRLRFCGKQCRSACMLAAATAMSFRISRRVTIGAHAAAARAWLERNRPTLYEEWVVRLPDKIHRLWEGNSQSTRGGITVCVLRFVEVRALRSKHHDRFWLLPKTAGRSLWL